MPQLTGWRFDSQAQRLSLFTDGAVQPRVQIVENPRRVVVDLPGTDLAAPANQPVPSGPVRIVRAGQFDPQTARMVIEMADGAPALQPAQVRLRRVAPEQWLVQLLPNVPPPPVPASPSPPVSPVYPPTITPLPGTAARSVEVSGMEVRPEGFLIKTAGAVRADARRLEELPPRIVVDIDSAELSTGFTNRSIATNQQNVTRLRIGQFQDNPPVARAVLELTPNDTTSLWEASYRPDLGGVLVRPTGSANLPTAPQGEKATLQSAQLTPEGIVFNTDRPPQLSTNWENPNEYRLVFEPAQLPDNFSGPTISATSPIDSLRLKQTDDRTVVALIRVLPGTRVGDPRPLDADRRRILLPLITKDQLPPPSSSATYDPLPNNPNGLKVVLDAGHGGKDPGAQRSGVDEKDLTLSIIRHVSDKLRKAGFNTILSRPDDTFISLQGRVDVTNNTSTRLFISVHINMMPGRDDIQGIETYYTNQRSARLAYALHRRIVEYTGKPDRGVRVRGLYVTRHNAVPAVLLEVGFISNDQERAQLLQSDYQDRIAEAILQGLRDYLQ